MPQIIRAIRLTGNLIALYFYNNSNNVAILLPMREITRQKPLVYALFEDLGIIPTLKCKAIIKQLRLINIASRGKIWFQLHIFV